MRQLSSPAILYTVGSRINELKASLMAHSHWQGTVPVLDPEPKLEQAIVLRPKVRRFWNQKQVAIGKQETLAQFSRYFTW